MSILDYLPFLKGWKFEAITKLNYVINRGIALPLIYDSEQQKGWMLRGYWASNEPNVIFDITNQETETGIENIFRVVPATLLAGGFGNPNNCWPWVSVYNTITNDYRVIYAPANPWSYRGSFKISALLPLTSPLATATISLVIEHIVIINEEEFLTPLKEIQGGEERPEVVPPELRIDPFTYKPVRK